MTKTWIFLLEATLSPSGVDMPGRREPVWIITEHHKHANGSLTLVGRHTFDRACDAESWCVNTDAERRAAAALVD